MTPPRLSLDEKPSFLITIDTEGDNLWAKPTEITTHNADFLPRFQRLCESHGLKPTYLTNYEMAMSPSFQELGRDVTGRGTGEVGMHLHAWNSPPIVPLTDDDLRYHPYLIEYPEEVMRDKIAFMTELLEETFGGPIVSHRSGRWSFDETYARLLVDAGYRVDCSVTPNISWQGTPGDPNQNGGTDYSRFPEDAYFLDPADISRPGDSPLLEIPMTILRENRAWAQTCHRTFGAIRYVGGALRRLAPPISWLRPKRNNRRAVLNIVKRALAENRSHVEFMLHSSELMPGASPSFPTEQDIENLYRDLDALFAAAGAFEGATLREHHARLTGESAGA